MRETEVVWNDQGVRLSLGIQYKVKYNLYYCISSGIDFSVTLDCLYAMLLLKLKCESFIMENLCCLNRCVYSGSQAGKTNKEVSISLLVHLLLDTHDSTWKKKDQAIL